MNEKSSRHETLSRDSMDEIALRVPPNNTPNLISPRESVEENIALWKNLADVLKIGIDKDDQKE